MKMSLSEKIVTGLTVVVLITGLASRVSRKSTDTSTFGSLSSSRHAWSSPVNHRSESQ